MRESRTAVVVGGGLIGCASAYYLARDGWQVRLLERRTIGSGASGGNCGFVCPSHVLPLASPGAVAHILRTVLSRDSPIAVRCRFDPALWTWFVRFARCCTKRHMESAALARHGLLQSSMTLYRQLLADEGLDCQWQDRGLLLVFKSSRTFDKFAATSRLLQREFAVSSRPFPGDDVASFEPALRPGLGGGWHFPSDAHVRPDRLLASLVAALRRRGVHVDEGVDVAGLNLQNGRLTSVQTSRGAIKADAAVIAAGAETPAFANALRCRIPIVPGKGYSLTMSAPQRAAQIPLIFEESHVAVTPLGAYYRIGSTMEFAGYDRCLNPKRLDLLVRSAREHLLEAPVEGVVEKWCGWRPMVYDDLPCIGPAPAAANVIVASGSGMIGLATAPATGLLVAQLAGGQEPHLDPAPFSLERFR